MDYYAGIDVSLEYSSVCVVDTSQRSPDERSDIRDLL